MKLISIVLPYYNEAAAPLYFILELQKTSETQFTDMEVSV